MLSTIYELGDQVDSLYFNIESLQTENDQQKEELKKLREIINGCENITKERVHTSKNCHPSNDRILTRLASVTNVLNKFKTLSEEAQKQYLAMQKQNLEMHMESQKQHLDLQVSYFEMNDKYKKMEAQNVEMKAQVAEVTKQITETKMLIVNMQDVIAEQNILIASLKNKKGKK